MSDLIQIQYEVVDKGKSLKTALTGVERMEKSLAKLSKEIVSGTVTQDRQRKALIAYGRELKRLTGMTGTQAYGAVVKYKNALVNQTIAQNKAAESAQRLARVQDYLSVRQERATLATQKQNAALHQTKNTMNGSNVAIQQLGYQFGDFAVQVQGGTSAFVAFSQQGSQLAGILPMIAGPLGLSMGAAVGLSAALGILIPIGSAVGRMFFEMMSGADKAKDGILSLSDAMDKLSSSTQGYQSKLAMLEFGVDTEAEARVLQEILTKRKELSKLNEEYTDATLGRRQAISEEAKEIKTQLSDLRKLADANAELRAEYERQAELQKSASELVRSNRQAELDRIKAIVAAFKAAEAARQKARDDQKAANVSAEESIRLEQQKLSLMMIEKDVGKDTGEYAKTAASYERENLYLKLEQAGVSEDIIDRAIELLAAQQQVTAEMIASADAAERLKNNLEIASSFRVGGDLGEFANVAGGLDAFGGAGDYEYDLSRKINGLSEYEKNLRKVTKATEDADKAAEALRKELERPMVKAIDSVSNAFGDFIADGLRDFKSFAKSIVGSFKSMISQMIATAARNKIMLSLGLGGSGFAAQAAAGNVAGVGGNAAFGPIGSFIGSFAGGGAAGSGLLGGLGTGLSAFGGGIGAGFGASFGSLGTLLSGGSTVAAGGAGFAATLGAAIPAIAAVAVVIGLFTKKTKLLDSGLRTTVEGFDVAIETFKKTQSSRLFGLLKSRAKTSYEAASAEVADPLIEAIGNMQQSIVDAAGTLGIGANAFDYFSYQFKLSLKGLTEEEQLKKINEEITKMGDSFASLTGHFETMNELLEAANQRMQLQNRLDQLLGNNAAILARQREAELKAMHELNRPLAQTIYNLEDALLTLSQANALVETSLSNLRNLMAEELSGAINNLNSAMTGLGSAMQSALSDAEQGIENAQSELDRAVQARVDTVNSSFDAIIDNLEANLDAASDKANASRTIFNLLDSSLRDRRASSLSQTGASRATALEYVRSGGTDEKRLESSLRMLSEPSEQLFSTFEDYARDFAITSNVIEESKELALATLTADEKAVVALEEQIDQNEDSRLLQVSNLEAILETEGAVLSVKEAVQAVSDAQSTYDQVKANHDSLISQFPELGDKVLTVEQAVKEVLAAQSTHDQVKANHAELVSQFPQLNQSVLSIKDAISDLASAISQQATASSAASAAAAAASAAASAAVADKSFSEQFGTGTKHGSFDLASIGSSSELMQAAASLGVQTAGQTGAQIQQAVANASGMAVSMGSDIRAKQFAMGGYHTGGLRMVGERGPELEATGPSRIFSHNQTSGMFRDPDLKEAVNELRREVSGLRGEQRQMQATNAKYVKRNYDINRKWDVDGLPATRT